MKILIISGTPKDDGLTHSFVWAAHEVAEVAGAECEVVKLSALALKKCRMCGDGWGVCFSGHTCKFGDDDGFNALNKKLGQADAFVFVTPVYWGEVSEDMKLFFDRLRRCEATKQWDKNDKVFSNLAGKPSILVAVAGGGGGGLLTCLAQMERALAHMGADAQPREISGIFDIFAINRWNAKYKLEALQKAVAEMISDDRPYE